MQRPNLYQAQLRHRIYLLFLLILCCLAPVQGPGQSTDEEERLKQLFLKSRQQMEIVPSPTPKPKPTPAAAPSPARKNTPHRERQPQEEEEQEETPAQTPEATPTRVPTPEPRPTPQIQPQPTPTPRPKKRHGWFIFGGGSERNENQIVIQKSGGQAELVPATGKGGSRWRYLTPEIRRAIDQAPVARNRWKYIVVHNSGTRQGNARIFDYYHRHVRGMPNGLAYHFVIGNGTDSGNGQIEIGNRWTRQLSGGHVHSDYLNYIALGICLVGDFNRDLPTQAQYEALDELIRYLRQRVGKVDGHYSIVLGHKEINPRPTDCPGARFPLTWLHRTFPNQ